MRFFLLSLCLLMVVLTGYTLQVENMTYVSLDQVSIRHHEQPSRNALTSNEIKTLNKREIVQSPFPYESTVTPGKVVPHPLSGIKPLTNFFVVGSDDASVEWLIQHRALFMAHQAVGLLTHVESAKEVERIERQTGWSILTPVSLDGLVSTLGVSHYPFYVINGEVGQ